LLIFPLFQEPDLFYKTREEQSQLLQQVLAASDVDADEERIPGEGPRTGPAVSTLGSDCYVHGFYAVFVHLYFNKSHFLN
jgi:DNA excision repair protein ERCC-3